VDWTALVLLMLPGLAVLPDVPGRRDPVVALTGAAVFALALHVVSYWWLGSLGLNLEQLLFGLAAVGGLAAITRHRAIRSALSELEPVGLLVLGVLLLVAALRFSLLSYPVPPGADMSMHGYMARLIQLAGGVPTSHLPLLPIHDFGTYAAGIPSLAAELSAAGGASVARTSLLIVTLIHFLLTPTVYAFARRVVGPLPALAAALICTVAVRDPQHHVLWGGNPTVAALLFAAWGLLALEAIEDKQGWGTVLFGSFCLAAAPECHAVLPYALVYILPPILLWRLFRRPASQRSGIVGRALVMAVVAGALTLPYLRSFGISLTPDQLEWIHRFQLLPKHVPWGEPWLWPVTFVPHVARRLGWFFGVWLVLAVAYLVKQRRRSIHLAEAAALFALVFLLVCNAAPWLLPASYAIYPDRIMLLLVLPAARVLALAAADIPRQRVLLAVVLVSAIFPAWRHYLAVDGHMPVTHDDITAIAWIADNVPEKAVIDTSYGDAGLWIPALATRPASNAHVNIVYEDEVVAWRQALRPDWAFIGSKRVYPGPTLDRAALDASPSWTLRHTTGAAAVYERTKSAHQP
jgi:hypothetical protein